MPSKSKILQSVETVNLDDGVEAITQPRKSKISPPFKCTRRVKLLAIIGALAAFVAVLLIVTFSLVAAVVGRNESGGGIGPTSIPPPVSCNKQPNTRFACRLSGGQVITTERDCLISGCCWNSTLQTKCFSGSPNMCPSDLTKRLSCSNSNDKPSCTTGGCFWDAKVPSMPCFRPFAVKCPASDDMRFNCRPSTNQICQVIVSSAPSEAVAGTHSRVCNALSQLTMATPLVVLSRTAMEFCLILLANLTSLLCLDRKLSN